MFSIHKFFYSPSTTSAKNQYIGYGTFQNNDTPPKLVIQIQFLIKENDLSLTLN